MKIVVFGLTVSSSWGNGHATLWRGLIRALSERGHRVFFSERDVPYYRMNRDLWELPHGELVLYDEWQDFGGMCDSADVAMVTSYCPDAIAATELVLNSKAKAKLFYDLDAPVTLARHLAGEKVEYVHPRGWAEFDLVLSYTGGRTLSAINREFGARNVAPLYGHVDPLVHHAVSAVPQYLSDLSYLGTYAEDRQEKLNELLVEPAKLLPEQRFLLGGAQYPQEFPWSDNIYFVQHLPPSEHPSFYSSSKWTLNITRQPMAEYGFCPSGRLFEAGACGTAMISDNWDGLDEFFTPGEEILIAENRDDVVAALGLSDLEVRRIGQNSLGRVLREHTSAHRALEFEALVSQFVPVEVA